MAQPAPDAYNFTHDVAKHRFLLTPNGHKGVAALIDYDERKPGVLDLHHTEVPPPLQGRGIAAILTEHVMKYARENKLKVIPSCNYISDTYLPRHPEYDDLIVSRAHC